jgi:SWI/SNF related-matrix-associated actin-dependent regulator of chromatin subfamily C
MDDSTTYGSPANGTSPDGNPILAQPPLPAEGVVGDGQGEMAQIATPLRTNANTPSSRCPNVRKRDGRGKY